MAAFATADDMVDRLGSPTTSDQTISTNGTILDSSSPTDGASATADGRVPPPTVPAACLACRGKHLKCDGQTPCSRCQSSASECIYIASRRGYKGPNKKTVAANPHKRRASSSPTEVPATGDSCPMLLGAPPVSLPQSLAGYSPGIVLPQTPAVTYGMPAAAVAAMPLYQFGAGAAAVDAATGLVLAHPSSIPPPLPLQSVPERCFDSFFHHIHAAHPFVLPKEWLLRLAKDGNMDHLLAAIRWMGSLYLEVGPQKAMFFEEALRLAYEPGVRKDGFLVQTLLLLILGLDGSCQQEKARQILADVERIALEIGLNTRPYATMHGRGIPVLEESWRRTWWDLYVVDGMVAGVHRQTNFLLFDIAADVALPCEEHQYLAGTIPQPMYLEDLEDREFSGEERTFSSFAYRVAAARILGKFMRVPPIFGPEDENIAKIEAMLTNWRMHLPQSKKDALNKELQCDEMMFQALMMTHATSILLHQPHSQLDSSPARDVTSCAPHRVVAGGNDYNLHTRHTLSSANEVSKMITHRVPLLSHSHFFTCVVTLSSIVHLSRWAVFYSPSDDDDLRQQIRLNIGALNQLSEVWNAAGTASGQVRGVAQEIYRGKKAQQANPVYWVGFTQEEVMSSIAADEGIMHEIDGLQGGLPAGLVEGLMTSQGH